MTTIKRNSTLIADAFGNVWRTLSDSATISEVFLKGGRGSGKSSFASIFIIWAMLRNSDVNAICFRRVGTTLRQSCYAQVKWAISILGLDDRFTYTLNPLRITYKKTNQAIYFYGLDEPQKLKSVKCERGYFALAWFEEVTELPSLDYVRNVVQSVGRGGEELLKLFTYNPPASKNNWLNKEVAKTYPYRLIHHSDYRDVPAHWLGGAFIDEASRLKVSNPIKYEHEYLGNITGTGKEIFSNICEMQMSEELIRSFEYCGIGIDWGYGNDPLAITLSHYDKTRKDLYIFDELYKKSVPAYEYIDWLINKIEYWGMEQDLVLCDSAEPKSIDELKDAGITAVGAKKFAGSRHFLYKKLQELNHIYVDKERAPMAYEELASAEYQTLADGTEKSGYPTINDHAIDSLRYRMSEFYKKGM